MKFPSRFLGFCLFLTFGALFASQAFAEDTNTYQLAHPCHNQYNAETGKEETLCDPPYAITSMRFEPQSYATLDVSSGELNDILELRFWSNDQALAFKNAVESQTGLRIEVSSTFFWFRVSKVILSDGTALSLDEFLLKNRISS